MSELSYCLHNNSFRYHPLPFFLSAIPDCRSRCGKVGDWLPVVRGEKCRYNAYPQCAERRPPRVMVYCHAVTRRTTRMPCMQPLQERIVRDVGDGLALEGASAADLVTSMPAKSEPVARKGHVA